MSAFLIDTWFRFLQTVIGLRAIWSGDYQPMWVITGSPFPHAFPKPPPAVDPGLIVYKPEPTNEWVIAGGVVGTVAMFGFIIWCMATLVSSVGPRRR